MGDSPDTVDQTVLIDHIEILITQGKCSHIFRIAGNQKGFVVHTRRLLIEAVFSQVINLTVSDIETVVRLVPAS